jgi:hypothetical protein
MNLVLVNGINGYTGNTDTSLSEATPEGNNGGYGYGFLGRSGGKNSRIIIKYDLSGVLNTSNTVVSAVLKFNLNAINSANQFNVTPSLLTQDWVEGNCNSGCAYDATWNSYATGHAWAAPGGDYSYAIGPSAPMNPTIPYTMPRSISINADAINAWVQGTVPNYGMLIRADDEGLTSGAHYMTLLMSEIGSTSLRPQLDIYYY